MPPDSEQELALRLYLGDGRFEDADMLPICMVDAETLAQFPQDVHLYLRDLRRQIILKWPPNPLVAPGSAGVREAVK